MGSGKIDIKKERYLKSILVSIYTILIEEFDLDDPKFALMISDEGKEADKFQLIGNMPPEEIIEPLGGILKIMMKSLAEEDLSCEESLTTH